MAAAFLKNGRLNAQLLLNQVGVSTLAAVALLIAGFAFYAWLLPTGEQTLEHSKRQLARARQNLVQADRNPLLAERHAAFQERLAAPADRSTLLKTLFAEAAAQGLALSQADYQWAGDEEGGYRRLQINLPVSGPYPKIRAFIDALLTQLPAASLDEIALRRNSIKNPNVEATLKLSLFFREGD